MKNVKKIMLIGLLFISFVFMGCDNFFIGPDDLSNVTSKTTIKDFSELTHPIVVSMEVWGSYHLFGNKDFAKKSKREGNIFVVIDWENDRVFDWVFQKDESGFVNWRCIEQGTNPVRYCTASSGTQTVYFLEPGKTSVTGFNTGVARYFDSYSSPGNRGLLFGSGYENGWSLYKLGVVDVAEQKMYGDATLKTDGVGYVFHPKADSEGNFWVAYKQHDISRLSKIDVNSLKLETLDLSLNRKGSSEHDYNYDVMAVSDKYIFLSKDALGKDQHTDSEIWIVEKNAPHDTKIISCPEGLDYEGFFVYDGVYYNGRLYATVCDTSWASSKFHICEFNPESGTSSIVSEPIDYDFTENFYLRGNRIYFMSSRNINNISYMYYDISTGKTSGITQIRYEDVIAQN